MKHVRSIVLVLVFTFINSTTVLGGASSLTNQNPRSTIHPPYHRLSTENPRSTTLKQYHRLASKAKEQGFTRVIVELDVSFESEGRLATLQAVQAQQATIAQTRETLLSRLASLHVDSVTTFTTLPYVAMTVDPAALEALMDDPHVRAISEDIMMQPSLAEDTPLIGANEAWEAGFSGKGWTVAILDSGVEKDHPFLKGKVVEEACFSSGDDHSGATTLCPNGKHEQIGKGAAEPCTIEGCYHGTHVAGIAAGKGDDFSGVAKDANVIAIQVYRNNPASCATGECLNVLTSDLVRALEYIYELRDTYKIAAINLSFGSSPVTDQERCDEISALLKTMVDTLLSADIATIASAGNSGAEDGLSFPACLSNVISVGATDTGSGSMTTESVASFSNSATFLDLLAPGVQINSSFPDNAFSDLSGTSMAVPHVVGAWAVLKSSVPADTHQEIFAALQATGVPITDERNNTVTPRIQVDAALNALSNPSALIPAPPTNLIANASQPASVDLTWEIGSDGEEQLTIERQQTDSNWETVETITSRATSYADKHEVDCNTSYIYRIRACNEDGSFTYSNTTSTRTTECPPEPEPEPEPELGPEEDEETDTTSNRNPHTSTGLNVYLPLISRTYADS